MYLEMREINKDLKSHFVKMELKVQSLFELDDFGGKENIQDPQKV